MGAMSFVELPREQDPEINFNWVMVETVLPGASAEDVEELVTGPLEDAMRNVQDIRWVISTTRESSSSILITVQGYLGNTVRQAYQRCAPGGTEQGQ